ncbi:MAG: hypothetical protein N2652_12475 [Kiritimatiellae bacterium]|nr:hypothetical protein [Kiritimatiellia bacterium]
MNTVPTPAPGGEQRAASDPLRGQDSDRRMQEFKRSPDPWVETARMRFGADRTLASQIQTLILDADPSQYPALEAKLLALLNRPDLGEQGRDFIVRMLALIGSAASVPVLAALLERAETSDLARYALEMIPGPEADAALEAARKKLSGAALEGLLGTLRIREARLRGVLS